VAVWRQSGIPDTLSGMRTRTLRRSLAPTLALLLTAACSSNPAAAGAAPTPTAASAEATATPPLEIHWVRTSAEHRAIFETTYRHATAAVERMAGMVDEPWAVIIDADETLLDNSEYQVRRARQGLGYTPESWNDWVREEAAPALHGAVDFTQRVKALGGHVAVVTNRVDEVCEETRRNLTEVGIAHDVVLCRTGPSEKETRFGLVEEGRTGAGLPPLQVLIWVGDNIEDFPGGDQELRHAPPGTLRGFGRRVVVLPNPMYGSWTSNEGG